MALISVGIGILPMWGGCCCIVKRNAFVRTAGSFMTALISVGIGYLPSVDPAAHQHNLISTHEIQRTNCASN